MVSDPPLLIAHVDAHGAVGFPGGAIGGAAEYGFNAYIADSLVIVHHQNHDFSASWSGSLDNGPHLVLLLRFTTVAVGGAFQTATLLRY